MLLTSTVAAWMLCDLFFFSRPRFRYSILLFSFHLIDSHHECQDRVLLAPLRACCRYVALKSQHLWFVDALDEYMYRCTLYLSTMLFVTSDGPSSLEYLETASSATCAASLDHADQSNSLALIFLAVRTDDIDFYFAVSSQSADSTSDAVDAFIDGSDVMVGRDLLANGTHHKKMHHKKKHHHKNTTMAMPPPAVGRRLSSVEEEGVADDVFDGENEIDGAFGRDLLANGTHHKKMHHKKKHHKNTTMTMPPAVGRRLSSVEEEGVADDVFDGEDEIDGAFGRDLLANGTHHKKMHHKKKHHRKQMASPSPSTTPMMSPTPPVGRKLFSFDTIAEAIDAMI